jgi:hypothetical protein
MVPGVSCGSDSREVMDISERRMRTDVVASEVRVLRRWRDENMVYVRVL